MSVKMWFAFIWLSRGLLTTPQYTSDFPFSQLFTKSNAICWDVTLHNVVECTDVSGDPIITVLITVQYSSEFEDSMFLRKVGKFL
jgi:hypothetical protein